MLRTNTLVSLAGRHKKKLWAAGTAIVLYTLLGFFLAPWLVKNIAIDTVREQYGAELSIQNVSINPYVLSLRIDGIEMKDPRGAPFVAAGSLFLNLQTSSLFRLAPTFAQVRLEAPEAHLARAADGALNTRFLGAAPDSQVDEQESDEPGMPRLIVHEFTVRNASLYWTDQVPQEPVATTLGPVNVQVYNLTTLPGREGRQKVVVTTESSGTFGWEGTLALNPLRSTGHATIQGSHMPLLSAYLREEIGFDIVRGNADVGLDYVVDTAADRSRSARVDNFRMSLGDVLIRTHGASTPEGLVADRDVIAIPGLSIAGGALRWPQRSLAVESVEFTDPVLSLYRDTAGQLNIVPAADAQAVETIEPPETGQALPETPVEPGAQAEQPWSVSLGRFVLSNMSVGLLDDSVVPSAEVGVEQLGLTITDISNAAGASFPTRLALHAQGGGSVELNGQFGLLPETTASFDLTAQGLSLAEVHPYLQPLADVSLDSGTLATTATVQINPTDVLRFAGNVAVTDFLISETDQGSRLGSWQQLNLQRVVANLGKRKLGISKVRLEKPYADILIAEDGSINLGRVRRGAREQSTTEASTEKAVDTDTPTSDQPPGDSEPGFAITVGHVAIVDGAADFADLSLPLPFEAGIAELNGALSTIATDSAEPSEVNLEGKVDEFGLLQVSGTLTPFNMASNTDVHLNFRNLEVPTFSPYTVAFAGRKIASGRLDLDLGYKVRDSELSGDNKVVLRDFTLGEQIEHPGAMSLPLGLAVALLKGPDGSIDIDLPVHGNVNDPEFRYDRVVGKALVNLIVKIAASPFALLGSLVGTEPSELDHIDFVAGRADLTPPEQERIGKLVQALELRPELLLKLAGVVDRQADGLALRTAHLDALIAERIEAASTADDETMYARQRAAAVEAMYRDATENAAAALDALRTRFTSEATDPQTGRPVSRFDRLAYTAELRRQLIEQQTVSEQELVQLATTRAENVAAALSESSAGMADRLRTGKLQAVEAEDNGAVRMGVTLSARKQSDPTKETGP